MCTQFFVTWSGTLGLAGCSSTAQQKNNIAKLFLHNEGHHNKAFNSEIFRCLYSNLTQEAWVVEQ